MVEPRQAGPEAVDTATSPQPYRPGGGGLPLPAEGGVDVRASAAGEGGCRSVCRRHGGCPAMTGRRRPGKGL